MLLFHGSQYDIKSTIEPRKAHCDEKVYGNMFGVYCSNNPAYAFAFSVIKNRDSCNWSYDGNNMIKADKSFEINKYVYLYYILSNDYNQISKKQFLIHDQTKYFLRKKIAVSAFVEIDRENGTIIINNKLFEKYAISFFELINSYRLLCHEIGLDYCNTFIDIISNIDDCDEEEYYKDHVHGYSHMWRTALYSFLIYSKSQLVCQPCNLYSLIKSAYYHDIGRFVADNSIKHGVRGRDLFIKKYKTDNDDDICEELIFLHDRENTVSSVLLEKLSGILKDADAIDRLRFDNQDQRPLENFINEESSEVYNSVKNNYNIIYRKMHFPIYLLPFAYNGPCITECGPLAISHEIKKDFLFHQFDLIEKKQGFCESPHDYLKRIQIELTSNSIDKGAFIGGNHLSFLPIYRAAKEKGYTIVVLDAHRDYLEQDEISHASFIKYLSDIPIIIFGYRDRIDSVAPDNVTLFPVNKLSEFLEYISKLDYVYLDIDIDVLDPSEFPCTYSKINGGIMKSDLFNIIKHLSSKIKWLSISEYAPVLDYDKYYQIIEKILLMAFRRIYE